MKETVFIAKNQEKWERFEKLISKKEGIDPEELADLYAQITDDLAYAQTNYPKRSVRVYLNNLSQQVYNQTHKRKKSNFRTSFSQWMSAPLHEKKEAKSRLMHALKPIKKKLITFWKDDVPTEMFRARKSLLTAIIVFGIGVIIGITSTYSDENFLAAITGEGYVHTTEANINAGKPLDIYGDSSEMLTFYEIALNNMRVAIYTFVLGIVFSVGSAFFLFYNGIMVGAFQWFFAVRGLLLTSFLTIWIHGAFEIPAIIIAGTAGITLGNGWLFPGTLSRLQSMLISAKSGVKIMLSVIPVILLAAFIEGFATRHAVISTSGTAYNDEWPDWVKWMIILSSFSLMIGYYGIYPFVVAKRKKLNDSVETNPKHFKKKKITLYKLGEFAELFSDTFTIFRQNTKLLLVSFGCALTLGITLIFTLWNSILSDYMLETDFFQNPIFARIFKMWNNLEFINGWAVTLNWKLLLLLAILFNLQLTFCGFMVEKIRNEKIELKRFIWTNYAKTFVPIILIGLIIMTTPFWLKLIGTIFIPFVGFIAVHFYFHPGSIITSSKTALRMAYHNWGKIYLSLVSFAGMSLLLFFFGIIPLELLKDQILDWFAVPLISEYNWALSAVDCVIYFAFFQLLFLPMCINFLLNYFAAYEKEFAYGLFEKAKHFGTSSSIYERPYNEAQHALTSSNIQPFTTE